MCFLSSAFHWPQRFLVLRAILVVIGGFLVHFTLGTIYTFGNMAPYIVSYIRNQSHPEDLEDTTSTWVFACALTGQGGAMFFGGWLVNKIGTKFTTLLGSWIMSAGVALSFFTIKVSFWLFLVSYGILFGVGVGVAYIGPLTSAMKWMPKWKGLANGIVVSGIGLGALVINAIQTVYINPDNLAPHPTNPDNPKQKYFTDPDLIERIPWMFVIMGGSYAVMQLIGSLLITDPPPGFGSEDEPSSQKSENEVEGNVSEKVNNNGSTNLPQPDPSELIPSAEQEGYIVAESQDIGEIGGDVAQASSTSSTPSSLLRGGVQLNGIQNDDDEYSDDEFVEEEKLKLLKEDLEAPIPDAQDTKKADLESSPLSQTNNVISSLHPKQVLLKPNFYILWFMFLSNGIAVIFTSTLYKIFGQEFITNDHYFAAVGSVSAIFNCAGRIVWGLVADLVSYKFSLVIVSAVMTIFMLTFYSTILGGRVMYFVWVCVIFFCIGGNFSLFPTAIGRAFGLKYAPVNYGMLFTSQVVAGSLGALLSTSLRSLIGFYGLMFLVSVFSCIGLLLALVYKPKKCVSLHCDSNCTRQKVKCF